MRSRGTTSHCRPARAARVRAENQVAAHEAHEDARAKRRSLAAWDEVPVSDWNYALAVSGEGDPKAEAKAVGDAFPWTPGAVPVVLTAPARKVPSWTLTPAGESPPLPPADAAQADEVTQVQLIPYGATHPRVSVFPRGR